MNKIVFTLIIVAPCSVYGNTPCTSKPGTQHGVTYTYSSSGNQESCTYSTGESSSKDGKKTITYTITYTDSSRSKSKSEGFTSTWDQILPPPHGSTTPLHSTITTTVEARYVRKTNGDIKMTGYECSPNACTNGASEYAKIEANFNSLKKTFEGN